LVRGNYKITPEIAEKLYTAIMTDTGNFRFNSTTSRGMKVAAELIDAGAQPKKIFDNVYGKAASATIKLLGKTLDTLTVTANGDISFMAVTQENINRAGARIEDSEGFVDFSIAINGVKMGLLFKEVDTGEVKISIRSQNGIDAAGFAKIFDGGGHVNAAGFTLHRKLADAIEQVLARAEEYIHAA
jgi:phosphoesterase RecJ-like protein